MNKESITNLQYPVLNTEIEGKSLEILSSVGRIINCSLKGWNIVQKRKLKNYQLVTIYSNGNKYNAVIQLIEGNKVTVKSPLNLLLEEIQDIKWHQWWTVAGDYVYLTDKICFEKGGAAGLKVKSNNDTVKDLNLVRLKWSLYYNDLCVVKGVDWQAPGLCSMNIDGYSWKDGHYILHAKRVYHNQPVASDKVSLFNRDGILQSERELYLA